MKHLLLLSLLALSATLQANEITLRIALAAPDKQPVDDVVVYLEPLDGQPLPVVQHQLQISQRDKAFAPYIAVAQRGQSVLFTNQDDITHHIYSATGDNKFSFKIKAGEQHSTPLAHAGEIAMGCNVHDWMSGYLLMVDTPYFDKTAADGQAVFSIAEPGRYQVRLWHPQLHQNDKKLTRVLNLKDNQSITLALSQPLADIPVQQNDDDFEFLSEY